MSAAIVRLSWVTNLVCAVGVVLSAPGTGVAWGQTKPKGDLAAFIAPDFCAAIVIHPQRLAESPIAAALQVGTPAAQESPAAGMAAMAMAMPKAAEAGVDLMKLTQVLGNNQLRRIVVLVEPFPTAEIPASPAVILQFEADVDPDQLFPALAKGAEKAEHQGATYYKSATAIEGVVLAGHVAAGKIVLVAPEPTLLKMLTTSETPGPLLTQLRHTGMGNDIILEYVAKPLLDAAGKAGKSPENLFPQGDDPTGGLIKDVASASMTLNLSGASLAHLEVVAGDEAVAAKLQAMLAGLQAMATQQYEGVKKEPPPQLPAPLATPIFAVGDDLLKGLAIKQDGTRVVVDLKMPKGLPELVKNLAAIAPMMMMTGMMGPGAGMPEMPSDAAPEEKPAPDPKKPAPKD